jgi:exosome complex component RRP40
MSGMASTLVLPGESLSLPSSSSLTLGPGIVASVSRTEVSVLSPHAESSTAPRLVATKMGILGSGKGKEKGEMMWVEGRSKRVSLGVTEACLLPQLSEAMVLSRTYD